MSLSVDILAVLIYVLTIIVLYHSYKHRGIFKSLFLLFGFFVVGGGIENVNITFGGYYYPGSPLTFYLLNCPLWVVLGWYLIAYCASIISHLIIGRGRGSLSITGFGTDSEKGIDKSFIKNTFLRALLTAYISMLIGLIMDPTAAANGWWIWKVDNIYIHGVPFGNYLGWVFVVFWTMFFHDILIVWANQNEKKETTTVAVWACISTVALFLAGLMLMGSTFLFGLKDIRTDNRIYLLDLILQVKWEGLMMSLIFLAVSIGFIFLTSLTPNTVPEPRPTEKIWRILPSVVLLMYWVVMMISTVLTAILIDPANLLTDVTGSLLVAAGIINGIPLFFLTLYIVKKPYLDKEEK
jgi:uncharacterized membrane protein